MDMYDLVRNVGGWTITSIENGFQMEFSVKPQSRFVHILDLIVMRGVARVLKLSLKMLVPIYIQVNKYLGNLKCIAIGIA